MTHEIEACQYTAQNAASKLIIIRMQHLNYKLIGVSSDTGADCNPPTINVTDTHDYATQIVL